MWNRLVSPFKEFGFAAGALYVVDRMLRAASPHLRLYVYELMVQPITGKALLSGNLTRNLEFIEISRGHPDVELMPARPDIKQSRFDQGAKCLGAYRKGNLIAFVWFIFRDYEEDEVRCTYELVDPDRSVFDFDLYVLPEHRMGIAFMAIWHGASKFLHECGIEYSFSRVTRFNVASRRAHARLGAACAGRALFLQAWRLEAMVSSVPPYAALTWAPDQRVHLRLSPKVLATAKARSDDSAVGAQGRSSPAGRHIP